MLKNYQILGAEWLTKDRFRLLADDCGLGKSLQAITAIHHIAAFKILVVCPAVVRSNWVNEFRKWDGVRSVAILDRKQAGLPEVNVVICSYDFVSNNVDLLRQRNWDVLLLDEVHMLKSTDAIRSKAIFGSRGVCRVADRIWALSGTPAPNYINDLWILLYSFGATKLTYDEFVVKYCKYYLGDFGGRGKVLTVTGNQMEKIAEIKKMIDPIMLRRKMTEVLKEMPPIAWQEVVVRGGAVAFDEDDSFYPYLRDHTLDDLKLKLKLEEKLLSDMLEGREADAGIIEYLKLNAKSVMSLRRYHALQKVDPVAELVGQELESGAYKKIIIFAHHRNVIELLRQRLQEFNPEVIYGGTNPKKVQRRVEAFQNDARVRVIILNIVAGSTGINLTAANEVLIVEPTYQPALLAQAVKRAHRIGQEKPVRVRMVSLIDSLDSRVNEIMAKKAEEMSQILD